MIILTTGNWPSSDAMLRAQAAQALRSRGIDIYVIGVGDKVDSRHVFPDIAPITNVFTPTSFEIFNKETPLRLSQTIREGKSIRLVRNRV